MEISYLGSRLQIIQDNIVSFNGDAIVNAANNSLLGGGGVDGAIHRAAGPKLLEFNRGIGGCPTGEARISPGFDLPSKYIIHTVGPIYQDGTQGEPELLKRAYCSSLELAVFHDLKRLAFPAISCGVYAFPWEPAAEIALGTTKTFLEQNQKPMDITFICFGSKLFSIYKKVFQIFFS